MIGPHQAPGSHAAVRQGPALVTRFALAGIISLVLIGIVLWIVGSPNDGASRLTVYGAFVDGLAGTFIVLTYALVTISLSTVGAVISSRVARNPIGWILLGLGLWASLAFSIGSVLAYLGATDPSRTGLGDVAAWLGTWAFVPLNTLPITLILMLVPDGRLPSSRWRILPWLAAIGSAGWSAAQMFGENLGVEPRQVPNPYFEPTAFRLADLLSLLLGAASIGAVASIVMRFRRARETERQQIKWVAYGGAVQVIITLGVWVFSAVRPLSFGATVIAIAGVSSLITPGAIAVAILKYRLYDIDRLISRTVAYALVAGTLALVYATVTIGLPQILRLPFDSPLKVAAATLAAAALFQPLSRRLQALVDSRFNRSRYDAQQEINRFVSNLARTIDLDRMISETSAILRRTVQPDQVGVWIRRTP